MKNNIFISFKILIILFLTGCKLTNEVDDKICILKSKLIQPNIVSDIPTNNIGPIIEAKIIFPEATYVDNWCGIRIVYKITNIDLLKKYIDEIQKEEHLKFNVNDTCKYIINNLNNTCDTNKRRLPISNYCIKMYSDNIKDNDIYIISSKKGKFIENDFLTKGVGLGSEWRNGYSKGILVNKREKTLFFWLEIW